MAKAVVLGIVLTLAYAFGLGLIGFVIGFFGPMIWAPEANQGPLLGIFITGPGGFFLGGLIGILHGIFLVKKAMDEENRA